MKRRSAKLQEVLARSNTSAILTLRIGPSSKGVYLRYTTAGFDMSLSDGLYLADNPLLEIDPPRTSDQVDRDIYKIVFADDDELDMASYFDFSGDKGTLEGALILVKGHVMNLTADVDEGINPGDVYPFESTVYAGRVGRVTSSLTEEESILTIQGGSPMQSMELTRTLLNSSTYGLETYPEGDNTFEQNELGSNTATLRWGKVA